MSVELKSREQMRVMARAGVVVERALAAAVAAVQPGATTAEVNAAAHRVIDSAGARSNFLGYHGFPAVSCVSVNDEVVHGIPGPRVLEDGDVVSIDCGAIVDGWHGDSAVTVIIGHGSPADHAMVDATRQSLWAGIAAFARAKKLSEIGEAIEDVTAAAGLHPLRGFVGHGIGTAMHQAPDVMNYRVRGRSGTVRTGMCLAIEPMTVQGTSESALLDDDWTVVSRDGSNGCHWEHSVARHDGGIWVLTASDGGASELAPYGIVPVAP